MKKLIATVRNNLENMMRHGLVNLNNKQQISNIFFYTEEKKLYCPGEIREVCVCSSYMLYSVHFHLLTTAHLYSFALWDKSKNRAKYIGKNKLCKRKPLPKLQGEKSNKHQRLNSVQTIEEKMCRGECKHDKDDSGREKQVFSSGGLTAADRFWVITQHLCSFLSSTGLHAVIMLQTEL